MQTPAAPLNAPDWLTRRGGVLRPGVGNSWYVVFDREPQYALRVVPAGGKHTCLVTQTVSGKRLDKGMVFATAEEALRGGLEELRQALGW
jgi:hypothetical protein